MEDCLFCNIINKKIPSKIVYENDYVIAFEDIHKVAPIHVLIVPKKHIRDMNEIDESNSKYIEQVYLSIKHIAKLLDIHDSGYRVICNTGDDGGQVIYHIHFHLLGGKHLGSKLVKD
jgi:histidine triad (HIT) family protein